MIITSKLSEKEIDDIKKLQKICKIDRQPNFDSNIYINPKLQSFYLEYIDGELIAFLSLFYVDIKEIEIVCMVHKRFRDKGYFKKLLNEAKKVIPLNITVLYQIPSTCIDSQKLENKGYIYHHGEYELINKIPKSSSSQLSDLREEDIKSVAEILAEGFNDSIGDERGFLKSILADKTLTPLVLKDNNSVIGFIVISKTFDVKTSHLFAFCVGKKYRSKGYGKQILSQLPYNPNGYVLRVDDNNEGAKKLYTRLGFSYLSKTEYYTKKNSN